MPCHLALELLRPEVIIGLSVETWEDAEKAQEDEGYQQASHLVVKLARSGRDSAQPLRR